MHRMCCSCKTICFVIFISTKLICVLSQEHRVMTQSCDGDWVRYGDSCYRYYTSQMRWMDAFKTCQSDNGFLTDIENADEQAFLQNLTDGGEFWIGASDCAGRWLWYGSTQPWGFTKWDTHQPDNFRNNEHCGEIRPHGMWNDFPCSHTRPFVCKRKGGLCVGEPSYFIFLRQNMEYQRRKMLQKISRNADVDQRAQALSVKLRNARQH
ncbi:type-2 ice-structuring protein-like [Magallana gigas]|uniref:type-2 ice-structuring protein-like n=1 Tax=Magallana gigas TaxID=29159 RepID=UPI0033405ED5